MNLIFKCKFGSHLYGTNVPTSDEDYKGIYIPESRDIILQQTKKTIQANTKLSEGIKNQAGDTDFEIFSYQEFLKLLVEGQTVALDMLFATDDFYLLPRTDDWNLIWDNKDIFLHKGTSSFVGYCRTQAAKYGLKGGRVAAMKRAIEFLRTMDPKEKLGNYWPAIEQIASETEHMKIEVIEGPNQAMMPYWVVCDRKMGQTVTVQYAKEIYQKVYDQYGARAKLAEKNENIDWKALMHAVRVCEEAKELLNTGHITFPRPEKELLLKIRKQELPYKQVSEIIEQGIQDVEKAKQNSLLPEEPDYKAIEEILFHTYKNKVLTSKRG